MKISIASALIVGGLCAMFAGTGPAALAQGNTLGNHHNQAAQRRLNRLHAAYNRAAVHGNYQAAERAHAHAQAIRARLHARHNSQHRYNRYQTPNRYH